MSQSQYSRPEILRTRVAPPLRIVIERVAQQRRRSTSDQIRQVLIEWAADLAAEQELS